MPPDAPPDCPPELLEQVRQAVGRRELLLVADAPAPMPDWLSATLSTEEILGGARPPRRTCALLVTPWLAADRRDAVIARLRDLLLEEFFIAHPGDAVEQARRMGALGLRCEAMYQHGGQTWGLNHFDARTYKKTPDWLNSRHWANPGLWGKFRW